MKKNLCIVGVMALFLCGGTVYAYTQNHGEYRKSCVKRKPSSMIK